MASDVAEDCQRAGLGVADTIATVLACLTLSTGVVGLLIIATGMLRLASLVQYVPLPVVGGGWRCGWVAPRVGGATGA